MVHAVLGEGRLPFLAGVFATDGELREFLGQVPESRASRLRVVRAPDVQLPCFLVERDGLRLVDAAGLDATVRAWRATPWSEDPDPLYGNVYWLQASWSAPRPGTDYMGALPHVHVDRDLLDRFGDEGVSALFWALGVTDSGEP